MIFHVFLELFWLNIGCAFSQVSLIRLRKFPQRGSVCSPLHWNHHPYSYFGELNEFAKRGPQSSSLTSASHNDVIVKEHFTSGNLWQSSRTKRFIPKWDLLLVKKVTPALLIIKCEKLSCCSEKVQKTICIQNSGQNTNSLDMPGEVWSQLCGQALRYCEKLKRSNGSI